MNGEIEKRIMKLRHQAEEKRTKELAAKLSLPYLDLSRLPIEGLETIPQDKARAGRVCVINKIGKKIKIAIVDPENEESQEIIDDLKKQDYEIGLFIVSQSSLEKAYQHYQEIAKPKKEVLKKIVLKQKHGLDISQFKKKILSLPTTEILNLILQTALQNNASDVHFEPTEQDIRLRFRIDGLLQDIVRFPKKAYQLILSRVKLLAKLKLNITKAPQDGRFSVVLTGQEIEIRVSTLPGPNGETIALRLLDPKFLLSIEQLGLSKKNQEIIEKELKKRTGMILVTGPTGCGKTTTLYAFLQKINKPEIKIITLEEPIEYHLQGITQTQVDPKKAYTFASGLKNILRQDPDVILIGEIRDLETAQTALHAALTGHLVFSTLHTNDAAGAIPRLIDLGVKPEIIAPAINIVIAQRLVRKIDPKSETNYKGRIGIFELFVIDEPMEKLILTSPPISVIKQAAIKAGMQTMFEDGLAKTETGITNKEEIERVVSE